MSDVERPDPTRRVEGFPRIGADLDLLEPRRIGWWARRRRARQMRRDCFHHDHHSGDSWIGEALIDVGRRKTWWCTRCGRRWFS